jgi:hypothetical protein
VANPYPADVVDDNGIVRIGGLLDFTDPGNQPGSTYTPPQQHVLMSGDDVSIDDGQAAFITWDSVQGGTDVGLIDLTGPAGPLVIETGVYVVSVCVDGQSLTTGGSYNLTLKLDAQGGDTTQFDIRSSVSAEPTTSDLLTTVTGAYLVTAGDAIQVLVRNNDGVAARNFALNFGAVQRVS